MDGKFNNSLYFIISKATDYAKVQPYTGMRKFRIDLIENWHMIYIVPLVLLKFIFE